MYFGDVDSNGFNIIGRESVSKEGVVVGELVIDFESSELVENLGSDPGLRVESNKISVLAIDRSEMKDELDDLKDEILEDEYIKGGIFDHLGEHGYFGGDDDIEQQYDDEDEYFDLEDYQQMQLSDLELEITYIEVIKIDGEDATLKITFKDAAR